MTARLTIAIPTYDRNALLAEHVALLLPQLTPDCRLVVFDNCSPTPAAETLAPVLAEHPGGAVEVVRHRVNIGSAANLMRCLETCPSPWLWVLGDDDRPLPDAVGAALDAIDRYGDCLLISFASMGSVIDTERRTEGLNEFVLGVPHFANLTLISSNLLRADRLAPYVRTGYFFAYSLYPHTACVLSALHADGGACCFSPRSLVTWGPVSAWSRVMAGAGMGTLLDLPMPRAARRELARMLVGVCGRYSSLVVHLLGRVASGYDRATARHLFRQAWYRLYRHWNRPWHFLVRLAGGVALTFPHAAWALYGTYSRWRGNKRPAVPADELRRM
jgi:glycosyltransferase involved in cell wall biosynthesis